jgi:predicted TIM-barrel fold metal-dependent hydrolase
VVGALAIAVVTSTLWAPALVVGTPTAKPSAWRAAISPEAAALVDRALDGLGPVYDHHVHLAGTGHEGSGVTINEELRSVLSPVALMKTLIYQAAGGVEEFEKADSAYVERLQSLVEHHPGDVTVALLAFEAYHDESGIAVPEKTSFHIPNAWTFEVAARLGERFEAVASIHPYRADATEALRKWHAAGGRMIKWLPNSMGIDPASPRCDPFYDAMAELGITLLSHAGDEHAVDGETRQSLGNPLRLRRALDRGVTVIVAHCGGLGTGADLDGDEGATETNFNLFLRLMAEPPYEKLLFGEISAVVLANRHGEPLAELLARSELHHRLGYGSDYPLPAIDWLIQTHTLAGLGYITEDEANLLDEIFGVNPLLFDLVLKRTLRAPGSAEGFDRAVFSRQIRAQPRAR